LLKKSIKIRVKILLQYDMSLLSDTTTSLIDAWIAKYPTAQKQSAVMEALRLVQLENNNSLSKEHIEAVADYLEMPVIKVAEVATFYENYNVDSKPFTHQIRICHNISCMLKGGDNLIEYLQQKLEVKNGGITADGKFQLKKVECLGACVGAPMMQIGDNYYENLSKDKLDDILENL
jgi:NADH-quinone oxidoreductase subunit E